MRFAATVFLALLLIAPAVAQESPSYKQREHAINSGGHPQQGTVLNSSNHRVTLDALGDAVVTTGLAGASYRIDAGFIGSFPPPGEVRGFLLKSATAMAWNPEKSTGSYNVYRGDLIDLSGLGYGSCLQSGLVQPEAYDLDVPPENRGWFYLVTAENRIVEEGTKGSDSSGAERANAAPCP